MALDVRLNWFRSLPMSCVDVLDLSVDGVAVPADAVHLTYDGITLPLGEWESRDDVWWAVTDSATLTADLPQPVAEGTHDLQLDISVRVPSFAPAPDGSWPSMFDRIVTTARLDGPTPATTDVAVGATLFSFSREYLTGQWDLAQSMAALAQIGGTQHVELLAAQNIRSYPVLSPDSEREIRDAIDSTGVIPSVYNADVDLAFIPSRPFDPDTVADLLVAQMGIAGRLGFPLFRLNVGSPELLQKLEPAAAEHDLTVIVELHNKPITHPDSQELLAAFHEWQSPHFGFLQDLGSFTMTAPSSWIEYKQRSGCRRDLLLVTAEGYGRGDTETEVIDRVRSLGGDIADVAAVTDCYSKYKRTPVESLDQLMPYLKHVQAKFYQIIDGEEPSIPYAAIVNRLREQGYEGIISSEFGGWQFIDGLDAQEQVRANQALVQRIWRTGT